MTSWPKLALAPTKLDPHPRAASVTLEDVENCVSELLDGKTRDKALAAIQRPVRIIPPGSYPRPDKGGPNNIDHAMRGALRALAAHRSGKTELAENALHAAREWLWHAYYHEARDEAHRYLEGIYFLRRVLVAIGDSELAEIASQVLNQAYNLPDMGIHKLREYRRANFPNLRILIRSCVNCSVGAIHYFENERDEAAVELLQTVAEALEWFLSIEWERPATDAYAREVPGWGGDADGVPFQADMIDNSEEYRWDYKRTSFHMPWHAFFIQPNGLWILRHILARIPATPERLISLIDGRMEDLRTWFWKRAYADTDDPLYRGTGPTAARENPLFRPDDPQRIARPTDLGVATGEMLWAPWLMLHEPGRTFEDFGRMIEALVVQGEHHNWADWPSAFFAPECLEIIADHRDGLERPGAAYGQERNTDDGTIPEGRINRARLGVKVLRRAGLHAEAEAFRGFMEAGLNYLEDTK